MKNYFEDWELQCHCGCNQQKVTPEALQALNAVRHEVGFPFTPTSAYRCEDHPVERKKDKPGRHTEGHAFDIPCNGNTRVALLRAALANGFRAFGFADDFLHIDMRPYDASWTY